MLRVIAVVLLFWQIMDMVRAQKPGFGDPNILLIMVDDMGYGDIGMGGNPYLETPQLDELANQSVVFEHFYVSAVCAPTRASLLTGRYHQRTGVQSVTNGWEVLDTDEITIAEVLAEQGYRTGLFGKWHLGEYYPNLPGKQGFDTYLGFRTGHTADYYDALLEKNEEPYQTQGYITDVLTDEAWQFMKDSREKPFFCYLPYNAPHTPLQIDSVWFTDFLDQGLDERTSRIYGMMENLDHHIGRLIDSLEQAEMLQNTIVIFISDNGPINGWKVPQEEMRYNDGLRDQKFTVFDGGIRTRSFWMWKDHWSGHVVSDKVGAHIDVMPTLLDVLNITQPDRPIDGISLQAELLNQELSKEPRFFFQKYQLGTFGDAAPQPGGMVRQGDWKIVNGTELYNLIEDPGETNNVADSNPELFDSLNQAYDEWWQSILKSSNLNKKPIVVGLRQGDPLHLQPHHGVASGNLKFTGHRGLLGEREGQHPTGVDGDWLSHWKTKGDVITWEIDAVKSGTYEVSLEIVSSDAELMIPIIVQLGEKIIEYPMEFATPQNRWSTILIGNLNIENEGIYSLSLQLNGILPENEFAVRSLILERI